MINKEFQERFIDLTAELHEKNQTIIAKRLGLTYATYSKIREYGIVPTPKILCRIADFFNVSVTYLLGITDNDYFDKAKSPKTFLDRLETLREKHQLSYYGFAKAIHVDKNYVAQWRDKKYVPILDILENIADHFNVSLDYLLGRTDDDTPYK